MQISTYIYKLLCTLYTEFSSISILFFSERVSSFFTWSLEVYASHLHRVCRVVRCDVCIVEQAFCARLWFFSFSARGETNREVERRDKKKNFCQTRIRENVRHMHKKNNH